MMARSQDTQQIFPEEARPEQFAYQPRSDRTIKAAAAPEGYEYQPRSGPANGRPKNKRLFSKRLVIFLVAFATAMIITTIYFNWTGRLIQDSIIYVGLAAILGELTLIATLTRQEKKLEMDYEIALIKEDSYSTKHTPETEPRPEPEGKVVVL